MSDHRKEVIPGYTCSGRDVVKMFVLWPLASFVIAISDFCERRKSIIASAVRVVGKVIAYAVAVFAIATLAALGTIIYMASRRDAPAYYSGPYSRAQFDPATGGMYCYDPYTCAHEMGHWIDRDLGHPSVYPWFQAEVCEQRGLSDVWLFIAAFPGVCGNPMLVVNGESWGGYQELYADLYAVFGDSLPDELSRYYQEGWKE